MSIKILLYGKDDELLEVQTKYFWGEEPEEQEDELVLEPENSLDKAANE